MKKLPLPALFALALLLPAATGALSAKAPAISPWVAKFNSQYLVVPGLVYKTAGGRPLTVDLYLRSHPAADVPTVVYIHGGAWAHGTTYWELGYMLPWMELGWNVVSVEYRLAGVAPAPAGVEDCFSALHWVAKNAGKYHMDLKRLVISGASAGGNLALLLGMAPASSGLDRDGGTEPLPAAAAIVSIAGVTDVAEMLSGPHELKIARDWIGEGGDALARRVSPINYVRPGLPPVLSVHGDADPTVPYEQAGRLHAALDRAGVPNLLLTIPGGKHGGWRPEDYLKVYATLTDFLAKRHLVAAE